MPPSATLLFPKDYTCSSDLGSPSLKRSPTINRQQYDEIAVFSTSTSETDEPVADEFGVIIKENKVHVGTVQPIGILKKEPIRLPMNLSQNQQFIVEPLISPKTVAPLRLPTTRKSIGSGSQTDSFPKLHSDAPNIPSLLSLSLTQAHTETSPEPTRRKSSLKYPPYVLNRTGSVSSPAFRKSKKSRRGSQSSTNSQGRRRSSVNYLSYEACMGGANKHEKMATGYEVGSGKARAHLERARGLFDLALGFRPSDVEPLLRRSKIAMTLATVYQHPRSATQSLRDLMDDLARARKVTSSDCRLALKTLEAEGARILSTLLSIQSQNTVSQPISISLRVEATKTAKEAMKLHEEVATQHATMVQAAATQMLKTTAEKAAEAFMDLARSCLAIANLMTTAQLMKHYHELTAIALDQASEFVLMANSAPGTVDIPNPLLTRIHLLACDADMARIKKTFDMTGVLDEEEVQRIMRDLKSLVGKETARARSTKGNKAGPASESAYKAEKQLGDANLLYVRLLLRAAQAEDSTRRIRSSPSPPPTKRQPKTNTLSAKFASFFGSKKTASTARRQSSMTEMPKIPVKPSSDSGMSDDTLIDREVSTPTKSMESVNEKPSSPPSQGTLVSVVNRKAWMPIGDLSLARRRRLSSFASFAHDKTVESTRSHPGELRKRTMSVNSGQLTWDALDTAAKHYKAALNYLSISGVSNALSKAEIVLAISEIGVLQSAIATACAKCWETKEAALNTAETYAVWSLKEIGWLWAIDGATDMAKEDGEVSFNLDNVARAALLWMMRIWWCRETINVGMIDSWRSQAKRVITGLVREDKIDLDLLIGYRRELEDRYGKMDKLEIEFWQEVGRMIPS